MIRNRFAGIRLMILSALFFAGMSACFKAAADTATLWQTVFFRSIVALPILVLMGWARNRTLRGKNALFLISRSLTGFAGLCCGVYATARIPLGNATVLIATAPIFVALLSQRFTKERVSKEIFFLLPFFTIGIILIVKPTLSFIWIPSLAALGTGFLSASAQLWVRALSKTEGTIAIVFYFSALSALISLPPMVMYWQPLDMMTVFYLVGAGVFATVAQLAMTKALALESANVVTLYGYSYPLFSFLLGMIFFGERPGLATLAGALLIIGCGYIASKFSR